ncbi:DUF1648 domain-containing protein [Lysinibacter cavernae]|uniref:DUF1648 domain-containing protein n=1 Tax=Lysinibacter cavernae TaxID=1640652 RepID=A0A7X5R1U6_9MICO|nr:DUF1648 domain-containing protein [Lysinibacter cavernae]NIH54011.1 hypothetical protein [Lysinibacter cavernae]
MPPATQRQRKLTAGQSRQILFLALFLPVLVYGSGIAIMISALPDLPDTVAIHWNAEGEADGFDSPLVPIIANSALAVGLAALFFGMTWNGAKRGTSPTLVRLLTAFTPGFAVFMMVQMVPSLLNQRGLTAEQIAAQGVGLEWMLGLVVGLAVAGVCWLLAPQLEPVEAHTSEVAPLPLRATERAIWSQTATMSTLLWWILLAVITGGMTATIISTLDKPDQWYQIAIFGFVYAVVFSTMTWRVTVSPTGIAVRSALGWPVVRVPLEHIKRATVSDVDPLTEFGGWGIRFAGGRRLGIILQRGNALEIERNDGKRTLVVTIDDADVGASLLTSYLNR